MSEVHMDFALLGREETLKDNGSPSGQGMNVQDHHERCCAPEDYRYLHRWRASCRGDANGDSINGDGAITQKRFATAQRWRRSVRGRLWPGKNTSGRSLLPA